MKQNYLLIKKTFIFLIALMSTLGGYAQQITVTGKVTSAENGSGVPGTNIIEKGTNNGVISDIDGNYTISVSSGATLVFSYIGYVSMEVPVDGKSVVDVELAPDITQLSEIVVIGYGTTTKKDATGSVTAIGTKDFNKGTVISPQDLLVGRIAGVQITTNGGAPGSGATVRIRGGSSLSASNNPLVVIDGVIVSDETISGLRNPLSFVNPNDIETFTVLKDASATAIYGSRASNGVIIITTKRGKAGQGLQISYNGNVAFHTVPNTVDVLSGDEYRQLITQRIANGEPNTPAAAADLLGSANTDWQDEIFDTAVGTEHNVSLSGAYNNVPYRASIGYSNQDGILRTSNMERTSISVGIDPSLLDDHLKINLNLKGAFTKNRFPNEGAIGTAVSFDPTQSVRSAGSPYAGFFYWPQTVDASLPITIAPVNPVALLELTNNNASVDRYIANAQIDYRFHFLPELSANLNIAIDRTTTDGLEEVPENAPFELDANNGNGKKNRYDAEYKNDLLEFYLKYTKDLDQISSKIDLLAGYSWQNFFREGSSVVTNAAENFEKSNDVFASENFLISFFGRVNYTYKGRYLLTATLRRDGSSRFREDNRWGLFPSAALAWRIKDESFMQNVTPLSDLKLRVGYGVTGQENLLNSYPALARVTFSGDRARVQFGNEFINTVRFEAFDANLKWEETTTYNAGLDFGFFEDRLTGSIDWYRRETKDLLNVIPVPIGTNFSNELATNIGSLENQGIELSLNAVIIDNDNFRWDAGVNLTHNKNEITKLTAVDDPNFIGVLTGKSIGGGVGNTGQVHRVGHPASSFFLYEQVYDQNSNPIEGLYVDQNEDGIINDLDRVVSSNPTPDVFMGFSSRFNYKDFSFSFNSRMNLGNDVYDAVNAQKGQYSNLYNSAGYLNNITPVANEVNFNRIQSLSDYYIKDASFFRMDNMTLGYHVGSIFSEKMNLNLSFTVQNAFVITDYEGLDPEVDEGVDDNFYPRPRTFLLGVNFNFQK
ncbi:TonB-dependent receptor [Fulvivirgaceae bacterium BMA10]|uniref:TonB-dependent receptor n=1 Tax=Splendidivirga corallicola TaxID=3051826 RepID=A0ABT8KVH7_9BACT|nr:TonB-dependent receptor [Fulvivirgaceae bacterium BMA10]